jgi:hypothetical protein
MVKQNLSILNLIKFDSKRTIMNEDSSFPELL